MEHHYTGMAMNRIYFLILFLCATVNAFAINTAFSTFSNGTFNVNQAGNSISVATSPVATNAADGNQIVSAPKWIPAFTHAYAGQDFNAGYGSTGQTAGPAQTTYRLKHYCAASCSNLKLVFGNNASSTIGANDIFVKASVEDSAGRIYPVTFSQQRNVTIAAGTFAISDPVPIAITNGDFIWSRTAVSAVSGTWSKGQVHQLTGEGESAGDLTDNGTVAQNLGYSYCPFAILGQAASIKSAVFIVGDSISVGLFSANDLATVYDVGIVSGLGHDFGANIPHALVGLNGDSFALFAIRTNQLYRMRLAEGCNVALCELGINDVSVSMASLTNNAVVVWTLLKSLGMQVYQTTLTPKTTSSDGWITVQNQATTAFENNRTNFNAIVRTGGFGLLTGFCDAEVNAGTNVNGSILWKPLFTQDGLHPYGSATNQFVWQSLSTMTNSLK